METSDRVQQWLGRRRFLVDAASALLAALLLVPVSFGEFPSAGVTSRVPLWGLALIAPLAWRRVAPVASAVAVFAVAALHLAVGPIVVVPTDLAVLVSLYSVTVHGPRWAGRTAIGSVFAGAAAFMVRMLVETSPGETLRFGGGSALLISVSGLAVWSFALLRRARQDNIAALRDRADRLERERDQQAQLAAAAERARIAREMHDVVAHSLSVVVAQADGGRYAAENEPDAAVRALATISDTGRSALADMRRILGVLRAGSTSAAGDVVAGGGPADAVELAPQPASADLEPLLEQVRASGVHVSRVEIGTPQLLPAGVGLTVYRICQEALTNVLKHAGPHPKVTVLQRWGPESLTLEISDDGRGAAAEDDGAGHGLIGMRERVALFEGTLSAGPRPGGGFQVRAQLPLSAAPPPPQAPPPPPRTPPPPTRPYAPEAPS